MRPLPFPCLVLACGCAAPAGVHSGADSAAGSGLHSGEDEELGLVLDAVSWRLVWDEAGLELSESGGLALRSAQGAELEIDAGWVVLSLLVLESCPTSAARAQPPPHGLPDHPSAMTGSVALSLVDRAPLELGSFGFDAGRFCAVGMGLFRADGSTVGLPEQPPLEGLSLSLSGRARPRASAAWTPIAWTSTLPAEVDLPLQGAAAGAATLEVRLQPASLLDGVDLQDDPARIARDLLDNLAQSATLTSTPSP